MRPWIAATWLNVGYSPPGLRPTFRSILRQLRNVVIIFFGEMAG
jgi:hypothetical protein